MDVPPFLICSIATTCNLHCKGCYARANGGFERNFASLKVDFVRADPVFGEGVGVDNAGMFQDFLQETDSAASSSCRCCDTIFHKPKLLIIIETRYQHFVLILKIPYLCRQRIRHKPI